MLTKEALAELRQKLWRKELRSHHTEMLLNECEERRALIDKLVKALEDANHNMTMFDLPMMGSVTRDTFIKTAQDSIETVLAEVRGKLNG